MPLVRKTGHHDSPAGQPRAEDVFAALTGGTGEERWTAARQAAELPGGVEALGRALPDEKDGRVREAIFTGLARVGTPESARAVIPHLGSDDASMRTGALDALRAMPTAASSLLPALLADRDPDVRLLACDLARGLPAAEATQFLSTLIEAEREANVCAAAVDVLADVGGAEALPALARCAERFCDVPFLAFSIRVTAERIGTHPPERFG